LKGWVLFRLLQASFIAAGLQVVLVVAITSVVILLAEYRENEFSLHAPDLPFSAVSFLQLTYLAFAAGVALTKNRYVALTTARIRLGSRLMSASEPGRAAGTIAICFGFASVGCAAYVLQTPAEFTATLDWHIGPQITGAPVLWSALMSVGVASFGSIAHAASDAIDG
jgi:hypothetical protein